MEVKSVLEATLARTKAASVTDIRMARERKEFITLYPDYKSKGKRKSEQVTYYLFNYYPDELWKELEKYHSDRVEKAILRRGMAKQSWLLLADTMGHKIQAPGYVQRARPEIYENVKHVKVRIAARYTIHFSNDSPGAKEGGEGHRALLSAMRGRMNYFKQNLKHGVFDTWAKTVAAYPGLKVQMIFKEAK
jgi:hypothetical protein